MIPMAHDTVAIAIGAICGAITRHQVGKVVTEYITNHVHTNDVAKHSFYLGWHTAFINITGSFLLGAIFATPTISTIYNPKTSAMNNFGSSPPVYNKSTITTIPTQEHHVNASSTRILKTTPSPSIPTANSPTFGLTARSKLFLGVGFCGSYTTFSTYSVDVVSWIMQGQSHKALSYVAINNFGGIFAAAMGMTLMKKLLGAK
jgi:fluoride ion exporter CrcB/FEX